MGALEQSQAAQMVSGRVGLQAVDAKGFMTVGH
jgi:hypothetical protein